MSAYEEYDYSKRFDAAVWKKIFTYARPFAPILWLMVGCMVILAGIDSAMPFITGWVVDHVILPGELDRLPPFAVIYGAVIAIQATVIWLFINLAGKVEMGICYEIRKSGFLKLQELSFSYFDRTPVGWLMARMTSDTQKLGEVIAWGIIDITWGFSMMVIMATAMFIVNWRLAALTLAVVPVMAVIAVIFQKRILSKYRDVRKINSKITGSFSEGIRGSRTAKTLVREDQNLDEFRTLTGSMRAASIRAAILSALFLPMVLSLGSIGTAFAISSGGAGVLTGVLTYGTLVSFIFCSVQFFDPILEVSRIFADLQYAQASAERVVTLLDTEPEIRDHTEISAEYGDISSRNERNWPPIHGDISFRDVSFWYTEGEEVLKNFTLDVKAGETIALVGETGSGKSTIVNLACRFYEPRSGEILIDGVDYRKRSYRWLHSSLGYVLQTPHLFSGTIRDNIRYGRLEAADEEIERAADLVNAHRFIQTLPHGYDTQVGEGGGRLSTGEKQLISFARAILADPRIFVLDEATSSVDTETEAMIQHAIERVLEGRTSFIIAHRLSTIRSADRILVIKDGRVLEQGSHHDLIKSKGYYYRLYTNQFMEERENKLLMAGSD